MEVQLPAGRNTTNLSERIIEIGPHLPKLS